jgi:hypothetical protein
MNVKAIWRKKDWSKSEYPERETSYELFEELVDEFGVIATIEQFAVNPRCFYANFGYRSDQGLTRSGCLGSHEWARQWCEAKTGNKVN